MSAYLYVDKPVASLQFDVVTLGNVSLSPNITDKQIATNRLQSGLLRVIIYGLNQTMFSGRFASADADVVSVTNIVGADGNANGVDCIVLALSQPKNVMLAVA